MKPRAPGTRARAPRSVLVGCSGWNYADWRERFYPKGLPARLWLEHYAATFPTVEVNSTFYRLPARDAVARWAQQTPTDFVFTVKASRYLTHVRRLTDLGRGVERFYERIQPLIDAGKLGPVLWQLPANFKRDLGRLDVALGQLPAGRHCFEFRDATWFVPEVYDALHRHGAALVIGDHPGRPFQALDLTSDWTFVRFHYGHRGRKGNYSRSEIEEWARRISGWRARADVYCYFNNDWQGFAVKNALELRRALRA